MQEYTDKYMTQSLIEGTLPPEMVMEVLLPGSHEASVLLVACEPEHYSASRIAKAVEDCDIQLLGLSVTSLRHSDGTPLVALRVGARDASPVARSLERYGMEVVMTRSADTTADRDRQRAALRAAELLHYLEI